MTLLLFVVLLFLSFAEHELKSETSTISDHYWRDYTGRIPDDAILAGNDKEGLPIYVGQALFKQIGLLPATISPKSKSIQVTAWGEVFTSDKNIKILCSQNPHLYRWVPTTIETMHLLTNCVLLPGGTETETTLYIGRAIHEMQLEIGKVYPNFSPYKGLALPQNGKQVSYYTFELLAYNCSNFKDYCL